LIPVGQGNSPWDLAHSLGPDISVSHTQSRHHSKHFIGIKCVRIYNPETALSTLLKDREVR
jgi:hypothetical protein